MMPPSDATYAVMGKNKDGKWVTIAFGRDSVNAHHNGDIACRTIAMMGGEVVETKVVGLDVWQDGIEAIMEGYDAAKNAVQIWLDKQEHDRCWYYPDLFNRLATIFDIRPSVGPKLPPRNEFRGGCKRFECDQYGPEEIDPDTVVLRLVMGFKRRKDDVKFNGTFGDKVATAVMHVLSHYIANGLTAVDLQHDVMPDYTKTKVELENYVEDDLFPTVQTVEENPVGGNAADKLDS
jgi:hypothetical protein